MRRPTRSGDALRDIDEMLGVAKPRGGLFELAAALDVDVERPVDEDVGDLVVFEKRFERPQPDHVVGELGGERGLLDLVELDPLLGRDLADQLGDFGPAGSSRGMRPATAGSMRDIKRGADLLLQLVAIGEIGRRDSVPPSPGMRTSSVCARLDNAAAEAGRSHFSALHQRRRSGSRPERFERQSGNRGGEFAALVPPRSWPSRYCCEQGGLERDDGLRLDFEDVLHLVQGHGVPAALAVAVDDEEIALLAIAFAQGQRAAAPCRAPTARSGRRP